MSIYIKYNISHIFLFLLEYLSRFFLLLQNNAIQENAMMKLLGEIDRSEYLKYYLEEISQTCMETEVLNKRNMTK